MKRYIGVALVFCLLFIIAVLNRDLLTIHKEKKTALTLTQRLVKGLTTNRLLL